MICDPIFSSRANDISVDEVFVLMPFTLPWSTRIWTEFVRPTLEGLGLSPIRADDLFGRDVMEDIWAGILRSRFVVADITERNPNVFYELGIAHTVGKEVILLTQRTSDIPFDLNRFRHIVYEDNADGYRILTRELIETAKSILQR